jgi:sterol desaturase/sphingolipid hydroxylase (fatty acid hydroxylase superfamily)
MLPLDLADVIDVLVAGAVFVPVEWVLADRRQPALRRGTLADVVYLLANRAVLRLALPLFLVAGGFAARGLVPAGARTWVGDAPLWAQVVGAIVVTDLVVYAVHRTLHAVSWLWRFHAIHHSSKDLDWLAAARFHPVDILLTKGLAVAPLVMFGFSPTAIVVFAAIGRWHAYLVHANVRIEFGPLKWLVATPEFHHWHHAAAREAYDTNYAGQLAVIDWLFGTLRMPQGVAPERYGIEADVPTDYLRAFVHPFRRKRTDDAHVGENARA